VDEKCGDVVMEAESLPHCNELAGLVADRPPAILRSRGRPKKRTQEFYLSLWREYQGIKSWFYITFGRREASDVELLKAYFSRQFVSDGLRAGRTEDLAFKGKLKTIRNELGKAKKLPATVLKNEVY